MISSPKKENGHATITPLTRSSGENDSDKVEIKIGVTEVKSNDAKHSAIEGTNNASCRLREILNIKPCEVEIANLSIKDKIKPFSFGVSPGNMVLVIGPESRRCASRKDKLPSRPGPNYLMSALSGHCRALGLKESDINGSANAFFQNEVGETVKMNMLNTISMSVQSHTTQHRKLTPHEAIECALILDGWTRKNERKEILDLLREAFDLEEEIFSTTEYIGDKDVNPHGVSFIKNLCCQVRTETRNIFRWKLEFICKFLRKNRPDISFIGGLGNQLSRQQQYRLLTFLKNRACKLGGSTIFVRLPSPLSYIFTNLFDKVIIVQDENVLCHGSMEEMRDYIHRYKPNYDLRNVTIDTILNHVLDDVDPDINENFEKDAEILQNKTTEKSSKELESFRDPSQIQDAIVLVGSLWRLKQIWICFWRTSMMYFRTAGLTSLRILLGSLVAFITGIFYLEIFTPENEQTEITATRLVYLFICFFDFTFAVSVFGLFALRLERKLLFSECIMGRTSLLAFHLGNFFASTLILLAMSVVPVLILYAMTNYDNGHESTSELVLDGAKLLFAYWLVLALLESIWVLAALSFPKNKSSTLIGSFIALAFVIGQGMFTKLKNLPANRYIMFTSLLQPSLSTVFMSQLDNRGTNGTYYIPRTWENSLEGCELTGSNQTFTSEQIINCLAFGENVWFNCQELTAYRDKIEWDHQDLLQCLNLTHPIRNAFITVAEILFFRIVTFLVNWRQLAKYRRSFKL